MGEYKHPDISPTPTATSARVGAAPATVTGMRLYLLRHASAQAGGDPVPDALRPLTAKGHREAADSVERYRALFTDLKSQPLGAFGLEGFVFGFQTLDLLL